MFKLAYLDRLGMESRSAALARGTAVHACIHRLHTEGLMDSPLEVLHEEWLKAVDDPGEVPLGQDQLDKLEKELPDAEAIVLGYALANQDAEVLFSEIRFIDWIGPYKFTGTIDQIRWEPPGKIVLLDLKTDKQVPSEAFLERSIQFALYRHAVCYGSLMIGDDRVQMNTAPHGIWMHLNHYLPYKVGPRKGLLRGDPRIEVPFLNDTDLLDVEKELRYLVQGIRMEIFPRNPQKLGSCGPFCSHNQACLGDVSSDDFNMDDLMVKEMSV